MGALIYTGWWFWLAGTVREQVNLWIANNRVDGREIDIAALDVGGFPGALDIRADNIQVSDPSAGWKLNVPAINGTMTPWKIDQIEGNFMSPLNLEVVKGPAANGYTFETSSNHWMVDRDQGGRVQLNFEDIVIKQGEDPAPLTISALNGVLIRGAIPVFGTLKMTASDITLPGHVQSPFGRDVKIVDTRLELVGAVPPGNLTASELRRWANDGGAVEVRSLRIIHGALGLDGDGTLALDGRLQPIGAFGARVTGYDTALDQLVQAGAVRSSDGNIAKMILGALGKIPAGGGPKQIEVPISVQDQRLSVGPIPLMHLPAILW